MTTRRKRPAAKAVRRAPASSKDLAPVQEKDLLDFVEDSMRTYGVEVNLERSVPDFRDGLKPVARRLLWAMHQIGGDRQVKAARLVGDAMGKYHPHGDSSLFGATVTMVNLPVPPLGGEGNWGTLVDPPASMRYVNCRTSAYGRTFFGRNYLPVTSMVPSFDRGAKEPLVLPTLLPNLLFNGASGIGVGVTTDIPSFTPKSVLAMMVRMLSGEKLSSDDFAKGLEFYHQYGGRVVKSKANLEAIRSFFSSTKGTVQWESPIEVDEELKTVTLSKFAPGVRPVRLVEDRIKKMHEVKTASSGKGLSYVIACRKDLNLNEFRLFVQKVKKLTTTKYSYDIYVTERLLLPDQDSKYKVNFLTCSIPELMARWLKWRCRLEAQSLDFQIAVVKKDIEFLKLLIYAADHLDVIFKALKVDDSAAFLVKHLKLTLEQANQILDLQVRRLSKLDQTKLKEKLKETLAYLKTLIEKRKKPSLEVKAFMQTCLDRMEPYSQWAGTNQFKLSSSQKSSG